MHTLHFKQSLLTVQEKHFLLNNEILIQTVIDFNESFNVCLVVVWQVSQFCAHSFIVQLHSFWQDRTFRFIIRCSNNVILVGVTIWWEEVCQLVLSFSHTHTHIIHDLYFYTFSFFPDTWLIYSPSKRIQTTIRSAFKAVQWVQWVWLSTVKDTP